MKVWRQRADFSNLRRRSDQVILVVVIEPSQGPQHVSSVGADAEFGHAPDIDRDFHVDDLTTEPTRPHREFGSGSPQASCERFRLLLPPVPGVRSTAEMLPPDR